MRPGCRFLISAAMDGFHGISRRSHANPITRSYGNTAETDGNKSVAGKRHGTSFWLEAQVTLAVVSVQSQGDCVIRCTLDLDISVSKTHENIQAVHYARNGTSPIWTRRLRETQSAAEKAHSLNMETFGRITMSAAICTDTDCRLDF